MIVGVLVIMGGVFAGLSAFPPSPGAFVKEAENARLLPLSAWLDG